MSVSLQQPMRPAEIELVGQVNKNTEGLASEVATRTEQYTQLHTDIEDTNATVTELGNSLNTLNTTVGELGDNLTSATNRITTVENKFPVDTENIADGAITQDKLATYAVGSNEIQDEAILTANLADGAVTSTKLATSAVQTTNITDASVTTAKLDASIQALLTFLQSVPALEFNTSNSFSVSANSYATMDISFGSTKTEAPIVLCGLQHTDGNMTCIVTGVTNQQFSVRVYNLSSTDVSNVTLDWLAISGR